MRKVYYIKQTPSGRVFDAVNGIVIALLMFLMIYPFWNMLILSFNDGTDALLGKLYFWPRVWTLSNYEYVFKNRDLLHGALVSVLRVVVGTVTGVICNALLGYIVSCRQFYGRKFMRLLFIITMYFGGGLIPTYLLMLELGFMNNFLVYIIPGLFSCYYMLLASSYIQNIPEALFESARIDGAGDLRIFLRIVLQLSTPALATIGLFIALGKWNDWYSSMLFIKTESRHTLQYYLYRMVNMANAIRNMAQAGVSVDVRLPSETLKMAMAIVATGPVVLVYPFVQRYFVKGLSIGAVKG